MIDIHSHVLYGIDDGSKTIEESLNIIKKMKKLGFQEMVCTPHYIAGSAFETNNDSKEKIRKTLASKKTGVKLDLGNETYINEHILEDIEKNNICSINHNSYVLIELPFIEEFEDAEDIIIDLKAKGYLPIIAHPERYQYMQKDKNKILKLYRLGIYYQCNYESIIGKYGQSAKETITYMLKNNLVSFLGSDIHRENSKFFENFSECKEKIIAIVGLKKFTDLSHNNALLMIKNTRLVHEDVNIPKEEKGILKKIFKLRVKKERKRVGA